VSTALVIALSIALTLGAGLVAGVFFAFSAFVMKALSQLPAPQGVAAMQRINVVVLGPLFLGVFVGTALVSAIAVAVAFVAWVPGRSTLWIVAAASYLVGCFGVTMAFNVPRNEGLARMDGNAAETGAYWRVYLHEWLLWNHVRTVAATLAAGCAAGALAY
jgi:uncharacterized membrane protein